MKSIIKEMHPFAAHFVQSGKMRAVYSYNEQRRKIQKPVLLRLRLAASEKPVLNAPASACVAEQVKGARDGTDNAAPRAAARRL